MNRQQPIAAVEMELLDLPDEALLQILRCLHYKDIVSLTFVNKRLNQLCLDGSLWKWQCQHYFLTSDLVDFKAWKDCFVSLFKEYGRYSCYREIRRAWWKIEKFLQLYCPSVMQSLQGGVTEEELAATEERIGAPLPDDLRLSLRIHNGQNLSVGAPGVMGGFQVHMLLKTDTLLRLADIESLHQHAEYLEDCVVISTDAESGVPRHFVAMRDTAGFTKGFMYSLVMDQYLVMDDSFFFVTADSFQQWLCDFAEKLEENAYHVEEECILKFYHEPGCVDGNIGITVKPTTVFVPELSRIYPPNYFFAYRIIIEMSKDTAVDLSCQLATRYWHIIDGNGREEEVQGPGVVGQFPVMKPGMKFAWISCTTFPTPTGKMKGSFQFRNLRTGDIVDVPCPEFHMQAPPCLTAADRDRIVQARNNASVSKSGSNNFKETGWKEENIR